MGAIGQAKAEVKDRSRLIGQCDVVVKDGVVHLWGNAFGNPDAIRVAAANVPGVKEVRSYLTWIEPCSGTVIEYGHPPPAATPVEVTSVR